MAVMTRIKKAWNAFRNQEADGITQDFNRGPGTGSSPSRTQTRRYNDRTIITSIFSRVAIDVAGIDIRHVKVDEFGRYSEDMKSPLNSCLGLEPNLDQGPRAFRQDIAMTLFDKGVACVVPVDTTVDPETNWVYDIYSLRVGEIVAWFPKHVRVSLYNEAKGIREDLVLEKKCVAIVENPLYAVMNEPSSTLQRLIRKLALLDAIDEQSGSGKLDLIIQLPYVIKSEARRQQAEARRADIEFQLKGSQYGIAYADGTEKITQLNRPAENNMLAQVEYLTNMLYSQLGVTPEVMNGTADEAAMINYYNRTVEPIIDAVIQAMQRSFLGHDNVNKSQRILYFRNPFKLVPIAQVAEIADKFTRNEILTANEIRQAIGFAPSKDTKADQLMNSNMPQPDPNAASAAPAAPTGPTFEEMDSIMNETLDGLSADVDKLAG